MKNSRYRVCIVGLWHLGCVYASCLAKLGYTVVGTDEDPRVVNELSRGKPPIYEPGLDDLIAEGISNGNLIFTNGLEQAITDASYVVIAYDTPVDTNDNIDSSIVLRAAQRLKEASLHGTIVVSSQVPVGTCEHIESILTKAKARPELACVPENLRLGQAIERFMKPEMLVIGANTVSAMSSARALFAPIQTKIIEMDLRSAEMTKHALNAFLATSISFTNEIGNLCDLVGADAFKIAEALKCDSRIGSKALLRPGLGFAGGTLARDLRVLQKTAKNHGYEMSLVNAVLRVNKRQNTSIVDRLERIVGKVQGKTLGVLGLTYKAGTNTLRRSAALEIIERLLHEGASVRVFDPRVTSTDITAESLLVCEDAYSASKGTDALLILNDSPEYTSLDFKKIRRLMKRPILFDAQNLLNSTKMSEIGFRYVGIGRGMLQENQLTKSNR